MSCKFALWLPLTACLAAVWTCGSPRSTSVGYDPAQAVHGNFSGQKAHEWAAKIVGFGPRPSGSAALEKTRGFFEDELKALGWETRRQAFEDATPRGRIKFVNVRARFPGGDTWSRGVPLVAASHYDTKHFSNVIFAGANDGASGNALMLELARITAARPALARRMELVFFDGEEAVINYTLTDGLHGSRHYQQFLRTLSSDVRPKFGVVFDMVGDRNLRIQPPSNSSQRLLGLVLQAASEADTRSHFGASPSEILDDHVPLAAAGLEVTNFIDFDFPAWHTSGDTLEKISPASLEVAGKTAALFIEKYLLGE
ncbi:MAG: M28 family peptidase [Verrucomicrobiales bacterium]